ncbi:MAG: bifunctional metallophosphatase/5'-nucleotidase [Ignavibacteriales bacterium CG_4_9_14_3_um_filter_30_11]|nr:MAG: bifunctional metallophosphatase/5'-nucleotidase [Ignavibacteriales bacterium CG_4_9_14_3_um_filter_30_11]
MKPLKIFSLVLIFIFISSFSVYTQIVKLKFIETTDVHGSIFPYDFKNDKNAKTSLSQVYTYVKQERTKKDQQVILLDAGDILQGQPAVYYYNFEKTNEKHLVAQVMNYMKYDVGAVGNHDIEPGHNVYDKIKKEFNFPWLAANAINKTTGKTYFQPYKILIKDGVKIAVLGMITPGIPLWLPKNIWSNIDFEDMVLTTKKWVKIIKEKERPDIIVGLFHSGTDYTYGNQNADTPRNENASELVAKQVPGFDIVFVGHDHHGWNYSVKNIDNKNVVIIGGINGARTAAVANVTINLSDKKNKIITGEIIEIKNYLPDESFLKHFENIFMEIKNYTTQQICTFTKTITTKDSFFGDSPFVDLVQNIQLKITGADVSFASPLSFNAAINEGPVFVRDMFNLYKYENLLYTIKMTGEEIKNYLEFSYSNWLNNMKDENDHLLKFKKDEQNNILYTNGNPDLYNASYNFSSAVGINYTVDVSKHAGEMISVSSFSDGRKFILESNYKVAINSYRGNGGGGHLVYGAKIPKVELANRIINSTDKDLRFYIMHWLKKEKTITPEKFDNWKIIPENWAKKGKEKDYKLLFGN